MSRSARVGHRALVTADLRTDRPEGQPIGSPVPVPVHIGVMGIALWKATGRTPVKIAGRFEGSLGGGGLRLTMLKPITTMVPSGSASARGASETG